MSSVSFPSTHETSFFESSFDPSSSFQMNPLSSHPPRTPRASVAAASHVPYEMEEVDATEECEDEQRLEEAERVVRDEEVWRELILTSNGRDKAFKLIQYSLKIYLIFHTSLTHSPLLRRARPRSWEQQAVKCLEATISGFSFSRKTLLLFNWLSPLTAIMAQQSVPFSGEQSIHSATNKAKPFLHKVLYAPPPVLLELVHAFADDIYTFSLLGLLGKKTGQRAARFSDWCWLLATLVGLVENEVERQVVLGLQHEVEGRMYRESMDGATAKSQPRASRTDERELSRLRKKDYWLQITRAKLIMDLIFVSYDVFRLKRARETVRAVSGLAAAILSSVKLFDRHRSLLAKALL